MALKKIQYDVRLLSTEKTLQGKVPVVYTNDLNSAEFVFNILDMTAEQLAGATATTLLYMLDGSFFQNSDVDFDGTTFTYLLKENEGNHGGLAKIQLVVKIGTAEYASQLYSFGVVTGLESKVAAEVMIQDWTTLLREARAYITQFLLDEEGRQATFVANEQDRQLAFEAAEALRQQKETERQEAESGRIETEQSRADAEGTRQTTFAINEANRTETFNANEANRTETFATNEATRQENESIRQQTETQRATAESVRVSNEEQRKIDHANRSAELAGKANKVQEAWITPTLINGWYAIRAGEPPQYMKDEFGFVHFRGTISKGASATSNFPFKLPAGYLPSATTSFSISEIKNSSNTLALSIFPQGNVDFAGALSNSWYGISYITFKAV